MQLIYNGTTLSSLGLCALLGESVEREPAEAPMRERHTLRARLDFFESTYEANAAKVATVRAALLTQQGRLKVVKGDGTMLVDRDVTVLGDDEPSDGREPAAGTTRQAIVFAFTWQIHLSSAEAAAITATLTAGAVPVALGSVTAWKEGYATERFDTMKPARRRTAGTLEASGSFTSNLADHSARQGALVRDAEAALAAVASVSEAALAFGVFSKTVRVEKFECAVNQPKARVDWTISAQWTQYPNESDYALLEYTVADRENCRDGSADRTLTGRITAPTLGAAQTRLSALQTELMPDGYSLTSAEQSQQQQTSESGELSEDSSVNLNFTFEWRRVGSVSAVYTATGSPPLALGFVEQWVEAYSTERFDPHKSPRRRTAGSVEASGWFHVADVNAAALLALKDAAVAAVNAMPDGLLAYGTFSRTVRVGSFTAHVNQPRRRIEWRMSAGFTQYPDESDFKVIEYSFAEREHYRDGSAERLLSGRIVARTAAIAQARLDSLRLTLSTSDYAAVESEQSTQTALSESGTGGDGEAFVALTFSQEWRRIGSLKPTWQRSGGSLFALGAVDRWTERYDAQLIDDLRPHRRRAAGMVEAAGWLSGEAADPPAALVAAKDALIADFEKGSEGALIYGDFNHNVRVVSFQAHVNQPRHRIEWSLVAQWTRYPSEANYALVEFTVEDTADHETGLAVKRVAGRIAAPDSAAARAKLASLRAIFAANISPNPYALVRENTHEARVDVPDGGTFISLTFQDDWQAATGDVLRQEVRVVEADDLKSGWVRQVWMGRVTARGATQDAAYATAAAKAHELGAGKAPYLLSSSIQRVLPKDLQTNRNEAGTVIQNTGTAPVVTVEFSFDYQVRGTGSWAEWSAALQADQFGRSAESVSGSVVAPDSATARALYAIIRAGYASDLLLNEHTSDHREQASSTTFWTRLTFSFAVHRGKTSITTSYSIETEADWVALERRTYVRGQVWGPTSDACNTWLDGIFLPSLGALGNRTSSRRAAASLRATDVDRTGFVGQDFAEVYVQALTGYEGIVECECTEDVVYSGPRYVEKPVPDGPSIIQEVGITLGQRTVSGSVRALTQAACQAWADRCRHLLLSSATPEYEHGPALVWGYAFVPLTDGYPKTDGAHTANVRCHTLRFTFREWVPELQYGS